MIYDFDDCETGERIGVHYGAMEGPEGPPAIGEVVELEGRKLKRVPSIFSKPTVREIHFTAYSQPNWAKGARNYTKDGVPCFSSRAEVQAYVDTQNRLTDADGVGQQGGEYLAYDEAPTGEDMDAKKRQAGRL